MAYDIVEGRFVTHMHNRSNWRLRDMNEHTIDPNWESGRYIKCHEDFRLNRKLKPKTMVFDLVFIDTHESPCLRSAFMIKERNDGVLYFESFYFADGEPLEVSSDLFNPKSPRTRWGDLLSKEESLKLLNKMKNCSYHEYKAGEKPVSISEEDWKRMLSMASRKMDVKHVCP